MLKSICLRIVEMCIAGYIPDLRERLQNIRLGKVGRKCTEDARPRATNQQGIGSRRFGFCCQQTYLSLYIDKRICDLLYLRT
jgi:hypothetical protein